MVTWNRRTATQLGMSLCTRFKVSHIKISLTIWQGFLGQTSEGKLAMHSDLHASLLPLLPSSPFVPTYKSVLNTNRKSYNRLEHIKPLCEHPKYCSIQSKRSIQSTCSIQLIQLTVLQYEVFPLPSPDSSPEVWSMSRSSFLHLKYRKMRGT